MSGSLQVRWGQLDYERLVRLHLLRWASRTFVLQGAVVGHFYTLAVCCASPTGGLCVLNSQGVVKSQQDIPTFGSFIRVAFLFINNLVS